MPSAESDTGYILVGREKGFEVATLSTACWSSSDARRASEDPSLLPTGWPDVHRANGSYVRHTILPMARRRSEEVGIVPSVWYICLRVAIVCTFTRRDLCDSSKEGCTPLGKRIVS